VVDHPRITIIKEEEEEEKRKDPKPDPEPLNNGSGRPKEQFYPPWDVVNKFSFDSPINYQAEKLEEQSNLVACYMSRHWMND
jgi:hypothetical protein